MKRSFWKHVEKGYYSVVEYKDDDEELIIARMKEYGWESLDSGIYPIFDPILIEKKGVK